MKVILLPGLDGTGILFKPLTDALPKDIDVLIISYPTVFKMSYQKLVEFVMRQLPKEEFILVGESFSGPIAYQIALRKPKNIKLVIFIASFLGNPRPYILSLSRFLPMKLIFSIPMPNFIIKHLLGPSADEYLVGLFNQSIKKVSPGILSFRLKEIEKLSISTKSCDVKAIYMQATNDNLVPDICVEKFKNACMNLNVVRVDGAHFILQTNPMACAEIIANEVRRIASQSP